MCLLCELPFFFFPSFFLGRGDVSLRYGVMASVSLAIWSRIYLPLVAPRAGVGC